MQVTIHLSPRMMTLLLFIYIPGQGGVGKSTTLKHIALQWAVDKQEQVRHFEYVYHIALKHVKAGQTITELIVKQHKLEAVGIATQDIQAIINANTQKHVSYPTIGLFDIIYD